MKKFVILFSIGAVLIGPGYAQQNPDVAADSNKSPATDSTFVVVETMPEFPGGIEAMQKFIIRNMRYPPLAVENNITGKVMVEFVIDENGNVTNASIIKGIGWGCDEEALRVINAMPKWKPGTQKGKNVKVRYVIPIRFHLENSKPKKKRKKSNENAPHPRF